jgi:hypothetical protein
MIDRDHIQSRRDALQAQLDAGRLAYADLEVRRDQAIRALKELSRHLDAMAGGLQELDALLAITFAEEPCANPPAS